MQRAEALRRDFHPRLGLGQATDVSDDRKVEAMGTHRARTAERMLAVGHALTDGDLVYCDDAGQPRVRPGAVVMSWWVYSTPLWYARHTVGLRPDVEVFNGYWEVADELPHRLERRQPIYLVQPPELIEELALEHRLVAIAHDMCGVIVH